jgi:benzoate-CoA ligase
MDPPPAPHRRRPLPARRDTSETSDPGPHPRLDDLLATLPSSLPPPTTTPDDVAFWLYSSGSTGAPKAAVHLHAHLARTAVLYAQNVLGLHAGDTVYSAAKLFFAYGLGNALTFPLYLGARTILRAERPTPALVIATLREHAVTVFGGVPTLFASLLAAPDLAPTGLALRVSISAGEALPRHLGEQWQARLGSDILDGIGSTELLHIFLSNAPGDLRHGTSGRPVPGYELRLLDDDGAPVRDGEEGSLWVRGPTAAAGYFNQRARSLATFHGEWTRTGDRYVREADGRYVYAGRADDMLKVGGIWVSPFEVESALAAHPAVLEAAVVGHPDDDTLIKPRAFIVLADPSAASESLVHELQQFVKAALAPYKYPRWIEFVGELPKTATGKIQRFRGLADHLDLELELHPVGRACTASRTRPISASRSPPAAGPDPPRAAGDHQPVRVHRADHRRPDARALEPRLLDQAPRELPGGFLKVLPLLSTPAGSRSLRR